MLHLSIERARTRRSDEGFTLIELLIVIIILGILAAIVVLSVAGITNRGSTAACQASQTTIDTAAEAALANGVAGPVSSMTVTSLAPNYLHSVPAKVGSLAVTGTTTVAQVDAVTC